MTADPNSNDVSAVTVKLPQFYASNPEFWFVLCESQFRLRKVIDDFTKFDHVVTSLPEDVSTRAMAILRNPPMEGRYEALKQHLLREFSLSKTERAAKLLDLPGIGDMKPSQLLSKMNDLIPPGEEATSSTFLFRELFLRQLPVDVRAHLMDKADLSLDRLALEADKFFSSSGQRIQAVRTDPASSVQQPQQQRITPQPGSFVFSTLSTEAKLVSAVPLAVSSRETRYSVITGKCDGR